MGSLIRRLRGVCFASPAGIPGRHRPGVLCLVLLPALWCFSRAEARTPEYVLSLNLSIPPIHTRWTQAIKPWADELEKRSGGRIRVEPYFAESLGKQADAYQSVQTGLADMTEMLFTSGAGAFPFFESFFMAARPGLMLVDPASMLRQAIEQSPDVMKELDGAKLLFLHTPPIGQVLATRKAIRSLDDLKGLKINVMGGALCAERLKSLGAAAVSLPMSDVQTALQQGVIDGTVLGPEILISRRWGDYLDTLVLLSSGGSSFGVAMNQRVYDSLPADLRKIVDDVCGEFADRLFASYWGSIQLKNTREWVNSRGGHVLLLTDEEYARADAAMPSTEAMFREKMDRAGYDGEALLALIRRLEPTCSSPWKNARGLLQNTAGHAGMR